MEAAAGAGAEAALAGAAVPALGMALAAESAALVALGDVWVAAGEAAVGAGPVTDVGAAEEAGAGASVANSDALKNERAAKPKLRTGRRMSQSPRDAGLNYSIVKSYPGHRLSLLS